MEKLFDSYESQPHDLTILFDIAQQYRVLGKNNLSYIFLKYLISLSPSITPSILTELSIVAYYTPYKHEGLWASERLLFDRLVNFYLKDLAHRNSLFYSIKLNWSRKIPVDIELPYIIGTQEKWRPLNPSILKTTSGYIVNCRTVNYRQQGSNYTSLDSDGVIRTRNFILNLNPEFELLSQIEIIDNLQRVKYPKSVDGLEDCRLVQINTDIWFTCTNFDTHQQWLPQISLCKLSDDYKLTSLIHLKGPDPNRCEKNWLPFNCNGQLQIIYSFDPMIVYSPDENTGNCREVVKYTPEYDFSRFRGSAPPISFNSGYLAVIHEVALTPDRVYLHRFVELDVEYKVKRISHVFYFEDRGIEFCSGLCESHNSKDLLLTVGIDDRQAYIFEISISLVNSMLLPVAVVVANGEI